MTGQAAGWYYAEGDPPGTQRYWDGTAWQGGPQPVAGAGGGMAAQGSGANADAGQRIIGYLIDSAALMAVVIAVFILVAIGGAISGALGGILALLGFLAYFGFAVYNWVYLQGTTGQTIGKKQQQTKLLSKETGQPLGVGMAIVRWLLGGVLASICLLDWFWILFDENNQRLSDNILNSHVVKA